MSTFIVGIVAIVAAATAGAGIAGLVCILVRCGGGAVESLSGGVGRVVVAFGNGDGAVASAVGRRWADLAGWAMAVGVAFVGILWVKTCLLRL